MFLATRELLKLERKIKCENLSLKKKIHDTKLNEQFKKYMQILKFRNERLKLPRADEMNKMITDVKQNGSVASKRSLEKCRTNWKSSNDFNMSPSSRRSAELLEKEKIGHGDPSSSSRIITPIDTREDYLISDQRGVDVKIIVRVKIEILETFNAENELEYNENVFHFAGLINKFQNDGRIMESVGNPTFTKTRTDLNAKENLQAYWRTDVTPKIDILVYTPTENHPHILPRPVSNTAPSEDKSAEILRRIFYNIRSNFAT